MNSQTTKFHMKPEVFKQNATISLQDEPLHRGLHTAMDMLMTKRKAVLTDEEELQSLHDLCEHVRRRSLSKLPTLLEQLEANLTKLGVKVHQTETSAEACQVIRNIVINRNDKLMVKDKSMVSEEIEPNHYLQDWGIKVTESDLGKFIIQMAGEKPTHIMMLVIHETKEQVSELFHQNPSTSLTDDMDQLIGFACRALRDIYSTADIDLGGISFAVTETGTLCLVENESNGCSSATIPPVRIAIIDIERVVAKLSDMPPLCNLLPRPAIGQNIIIYSNMITRPCHSEEPDGPQEVHPVLPDSGYS